jgi:hypothetical protein
MMHLNSSRPERQSTPWTPMSHSSAPQGHSDRMRSPCATHRLILERSGKRCCEEEALPAGVLSNRVMYVVASQRVCGFLVGSHLVSFFVELRLSLALGGDPMRSSRMQSSRREREAEVVTGVSERINGGCDSGAGANAAPRSVLAGRPMQKSTRNQ